MPVNSINFSSAYASSMTLSSTAASAVSGTEAPSFQLPTDTVELGSASSMNLSMTYTAEGVQTGGQQAQGMDNDMAKIVIALLMMAMMSGDDQSMDMILKLLSGDGSQQGGEAASMQSVSMSMSLSMSNSSYAMASGSDATASVGASVDMAA